MKLLCVTPLRDGVQQTRVSACASQSHTNAMYGSPGTFNSLILLIRPFRTFKWQYYPSDELCVNVLPLPRVVFGAKPNGGKKATRTHCPTITSWLSTILEYDKTRRFGNTPRTAAKSARGTTGSSTRNRAPPANTQHSAAYVGSLLVP